MSTLSGYHEPPGPALRFPRQRCHTYYLRTRLYRRHHRQWKRSSRLAKCTLLDELHKHRNSRPQSSGHRYPHHGLDFRYRHGVGRFYTTLLDLHRLKPYHRTSHPAVPPPPPYTEPGVGIANCNDLSLFTYGLSIVANQKLYLLGSFNQVNLAGGRAPADKYLRATGPLRNVGRDFAGGFDGTSFR